MQTLDKNQCASPRPSNWPNNSCQYRDVVKYRKKYEINSRLRFQMENGSRYGEVQNSHLPVTSLPALLPQVLHTICLITGLKNCNSEADSIAFFISMFEERSFISRFTARPPFSKLSMELLLSTIKRDLLSLGETNSFP